MKLCLCVETSSSCSAVLWLRIYARHDPKIPLTTRQSCVLIITIINTNITEIIIIIITNCVSGDVLSALSRNATVMHQLQNQSQQLSKSVNGLRSQPSGGAGGSGTGPGATRNQLSLVPVPYRNSKLTHLLKGDTSRHCLILILNLTYYTILYCTVVYCTVLHCTVLYCTVLYCTVLYCTVLYCTVLYCTVLHCTVL